MPPFIQWAHSQAMSGFIQLAHVGFHEGKGKTAHGISRIYCLHVAELCDLPIYITLASLWLIEVLGSTTYSLPKSYMSLLCPFLTL